MRNGGNEGRMRGQHRIDRIPKAHCIIGYQIFGANAQPHSGLIARPIDWMHCAGGASVCGNMWWQCPNSCNPASDIKPAKLFPVSKMNKNNKNGLARWITLESSTCDQRKPTNQQRLKRGAKAWLAASGHNASHGMGTGRCPPPRRLQAIFVQLQNQSLENQASSAHNNGHHKTQTITPCPILAP